MTCPESMRVQAYLDGETANAAAVETHVDTCAECAKLRDDVAALRAAMRSELSYHRAGSALRGSLLKALDQEEGRRAWPFSLPGLFWTGAFSGAIATACAAAVAFLLVLPSGSSLAVNDVTEAHLRSLMPGHLIDVVSSNRHTVKPWFAGRTDVSPPVADFSREGYALLGGRVDYVDGRRAAVIVYRHGAHIINVFAWPTGGAAVPGFATHNGYHLVSWKSGNVAYCAISDTAVDELLGLVRLLKTMSEPDSRE